MVCDIRNPAHQKILERSEFWDLIWDDSGHVAVFEAPGLLEKIPTWLKKGGKYVVGIPTMSGRSYFEESTASIAQKIVHLKGENTELTKNFEEFVSTSLLNLGFSEVVVRLSPFAKAMSDLVINAEILTEEECLKFLEKSKEYAGESAEIDPVFLEASLGSMYIVATR